MPLRFRSNTRRLGLRLTTLDQTRTPPPRVLPAVTDIDVNPDPVVVEIATPAATVTVEVNPTTPVVVEVTAPAPTVAATVAPDPVVVEVAAPAAAITVEANPAPSVVEIAVPAPEVAATVAPEPVAVDVSVPAASITIEVNPDPVVIDVLAVAPAATVEANPAPVPVEIAIPAPTVTTGDTVPPVVEEEDEGAPGGWSPPRPWPFRRAAPARVPRSRELKGRPVRIRGHACGTVGACQVVAGASATPSRARASLVPLRAATLARALAGTLTRGTPSGRRAVEALPAVAVSGGRAALSRPATLGGAALAVGIAVPTDLTRYSEAEALALLGFEGDPALEAVEA